MNPLNDHELLLWAMRAGLTRDEVRQAGRKDLDAGRQGRLNLDMEIIQVVEGVGGTVGADGVAGHADRGVPGMASAPASF